MRRAGSGIRRCSWTFDVRWLEDTAQVTTALASRAGRRALEGSGSFWMAANFSSMGFICKAINKKNSG